MAEIEETWDYTDYELLNLQLTNAFVAVFAENAADGATDLFSTPADAIGLARVVTVTRRGVRGKIGTIREVDRFEETELVTLILSDGLWEIAERATNFAGVGRKGEDIYNVTGRLNPGQFKTLRKPGGAALP